jgi:hypothetical protein
MPVQRRREADGAVRYGLLTSDDVDGRRGPERALSDSHLRPVWSDEQRAACEEAQLDHETSCAAYHIANGPFVLPQGRSEWTLRADDRTRAATLALSPLPARSVRELLKAGIINTTGVIIEAWKEAEVQRLRL